MNEGFIIFKDAAEARLQIKLILEGNPARRREYLADTLISLRDELQGDSPDVSKTKMELDRLIECVFTGSDTYLAALELYECRYDINGGGRPEEYIRQVVAERLAPRRRPREPVTAAATEREVQHE